MQKTKQLEKASAKPQLSKPQQSKPQHWSVWLGAPALIGGILLITGLLASWDLAIVIVCIIAILVLHEYGHFWAAKYTGMKVTDLGIGFGPKLWWARKGEVLYSIRAFPLGAFVRVPGMYMNEKDSPDLEEDRSYRQKPFKSRVLFAAAGPATHFVVAFLLLFSMFAFIGYGGINFETRQSSNWMVTRVVSHSPAEQAGIIVGDKIIFVNGQGVKNFDDLAERLIVPFPAQEVNLTVLRDGQSINLEPITLATRRRDLEAGGVEEIGFLGVGPVATTPKVNVGLAALYSFREIGLSTKTIVVGVGQAFSPGAISNFVGDTFSSDSKSQSVATATTQNPVQGATPSDTTTSTTTSNQPTEEDSNRILSLIGIVQAGEGAVAGGISIAFLFLIFLNLILGIFNLLPLLPFDGGHVAIAIYEKIRSKKKANYHADITKMIYVGASILLILVLVNLVAVFRDITDPLSF